MKWQNRRRSSNVEDRRGSRMVSKGGLSIGGIVLGLAAIYFLGMDPKQAMDIGSQLSGGETRVEQADYKPTAEEQQLAAMTAHPVIIGAMRGAY